MSDCSDELLAAVSRARGESRVLSYMGEDWDMGDLFGSLMSTAGAMCDRMVKIGNASHIPGSMGYRQSLAGVDESTPEYTTLCQGLAVDRVFGDLDIEAALPILNALIDRCVEEGIDY